MERMMDFGADLFVSFAIITFASKVPCSSVAYLCFTDYYITEEINF